MTTPPAGAEAHRFVAHPHATLFALTVPVLLSLIVEPLTGLVDTFFVARLGATALAGLGAAATLLSSLFWAFNFLGIGTQTEVGRALGEGRPERARDAASLALALAAVIGVALALGIGALRERLAGFMTDDAAVRDALLEYLTVRLLAAPAVLMMLAGFGALRGLQEMRTPLWIAAGANLVNLVLDPLLIFGAGPLPGLGVAGAAWATVAAHWLAALGAVAAVRRRIGLSAAVPWRDTPALLVTGRDLFLRTGMLSLFLLLATRAATQLGAEAGAAHQVLRQVWLFTAFLLDAYAASSQSLVAYFLGAAKPALARRVAGVACGWGVASGCAIGLAMLAGEAAVAAAFVPASAREVFGSAWRVLALSQPVNAVSFVTDGIHWGTRDYRYLRNAMLAASSGGVAALALLPAGAAGLTAVWLVTSAWIAVRAGFGLLRVWPGIGRAPLARA